jgi:PAS domain S-box-containing protein
MHAQQGLPLAADLGRARLDEELRSLRSRVESLGRELAGCHDVESELRAGEQQWKQLIETLPQIVWITRPDGWHVHFNRQWMEFTGLSLEESLGFGWNPPFHPEDRGRAAVVWERATSSGEPYEIEYRLRRHDGVYRWMLGRALPLRDADGRIVKWFGTCTDIDDLKWAQAKLEESRSLHRLAGSMARLGGWSLDLADQRISWSEEIYEILGHPTGTTPDLEESIGFYLPEYRPALRAAMDRCARWGEPFDLEAQVQTEDGRRLWLRVIGEAVMDPAGSVTRIRGAVQDVTAAKEASHRNEELAARLTVTFESITDGLYTLDEDWRFTYLNAEAERLVRQPREQLLGTQVWESFAATRGTEFEAALHRAVTERVTVVLEEYHYPPLGTWFQVVAYPSEQGLTVYIRDVGEQHRAQQSLRERVKELRSLAAINGAAHALTDAQQLCELTAAAILDAMLQPEHTAVRVTLGAAAATRGEPEAGVGAVSIPIESEGTSCGRIELCERFGESFLPEEVALARTVAETLGLWFGRHRATDALQQANGELGRVNEQLAVAARVKDDLLSMASHELRTPLTPIIGFLETLQARAEPLPPADQQRMYRSMDRQARRMLRLVDDLLVVSRATANALVARPQHVSAHEVLQPLLDELDGVITGILTSVDGQELFVDPQHLQQIVVNLLTNAAKYGRPPVRLAVEQRDSGQVVLEVSDHGPGIPEGFQEQMWERFTQKDRGDTRTATGTGLGLAIVKLLTEANGGTVGYRDGTPNGAVFTVMLPPSPPVG